TVLKGAVLSRVKLLLHGVTVLKGAALSDQLKKLLGSKNALLPLMRHTLLQATPTKWSKPNNSSTSVSWSTDQR
ncbi:hypothetical protein ACP3W2_26200, partial [Salmonella enterica]|uniref:hypothetical protein n=1 Tax=Salmonella enterica TaxID=28901 RepID=UPI003CF96A45